MNYNELILKVHACGICGTDLHWSENTEDTGWRVMQPGSVMGHEFAGEVVEAGLTDQVLNDPHHPYTQLLVSSVLQA